MTNPVPMGTRNTSLNFINEEFQIIVDQSGGHIGPWIKSKILAALKQEKPEVAAKIEAIRAERLRLKHGIITLLALCIAIQFFAGDPALRGLRRTRRNEAVAVIDVEGEEV